MSENRKTASIYKKKQNSAFLSDRYQDYATFGTFEARKLTEKL